MLSYEKNITKIAFQKHNFKVVRLFRMLFLYFITLNLNASIKTVRVIHRIRVYKTTSKTLRMKKSGKIKFSQESILNSEQKLAKAFADLLDIKNDNEEVSKFIDEINSHFKNKVKNRQIYWVKDEIIISKTPEVLSIFLE